MHKKLQELKFCLQNVKSCVIVTFKAFTVQNNRCKTPINMMLIKKKHIFLCPIWRKRKDGKGRQKEHICFLYQKKNMSPDFYTLKKNYMI